MRDLRPRWRWLAVLGVAACLPATLLNTATAVVPPAPTGCSAVTTNFANATAVPILDVAVSTSTINVAGLTGQIHDLDVTTNITHTFTADMDITLMSPAGTVVTLSTDNGAGNDNSFNGTLWDDDANPAGQVPYVTNAGVATDHPYVNLTTATPLVPEEAMAAFNGENPNGTWTLTVSDDLAGDVGNMTWSMDVTTIPSFGPTSLQATGAGLPVPIADVGVTTATINVVGAGAITDVNLTTSITHAFSADMDITVMSPAGTVVTLSTDNGAGNDNVFNGTLWDDDANPAGQVPSGNLNNAGVVTDHPYVNLATATPLVPEEAMAAFNGENPNGTWTLTVSDDLAGNVGSIDALTLDIQTGACTTDIKTTITDTPDPVAAGSALTYDVTVTNEGLAPAADTAVTATLPSTTGFVSATPSTDGTCTTPAAGAAGAVTCSWPTPTPAASSRTLQIVAIPSAAGSISTTATATTTTLEPDTTDNAATAQTTVAASGTLTDGGQACTILGTEGPDTLAGTTGPDVICGRGGVDTITNTGPGDILDGGAGNDTLTVVSDTATAFGGLGDDRITGGPGADTLNGGIGSDTIDGGTGDDIITGGNDADTIAGGGGKDVIGAGGGNDTVTVGDDPVTVNGGAGDDTITGGAGPDVLNANDGNDIVAGRAGKDRVAGHAGDDQLLGETGADIVDGGPGNDRADGGAGADRVTGGPGIDVVTGGAGIDRVLGGAGNDRLSGGGDNDALVGGLGDDRLSGDDGRDRLLGGAGADTLIGGLGVDFGSGNAGIDTSHGPDVYFEVEIRR